MTPSAGTTTPDGGAPHGEIWPARTRERIGLPPVPAITPDLNDITTVITGSLARNLRLHDIYGLSRIHAEAQTPGVIQLSFTIEAQRASA